MSPASNALLRDRSQMFGIVRAFFHKRGILEVDCPLLSHYATIDAHIDLFEVILDEKKKGYLHSSPEYGMKRLLAQGIGPIYQLSHVYRKGEVGAKHNPEFTLIEWYRPGISFNDFLAEIIDLISLFLGKLSYSIFTYFKAFQLYVGIDYRLSTIPILKKKIEALGIDPETNDREELLNLLWGCAVEPHLGKEKLTVITDYPEEQAALAQTHQMNNEVVAQRFEIYFHQMELGNGYHELIDLNEHKQRFYKTNQKRLELGKKTLSVDCNFLQALESGLPDSYGIAIGFDRLMMLRHHTNDIASVLPFYWNEN